MQDKKIKELFEEISKLKDGKNSVEEILKEMQNVDIVNNLEYIKNEIIEPEEGSPLRQLVRKFMIQQIAIQIQMIQFHILIIIRIQIIGTNQ